MAIGHGWDEIAEQVDESTPLTYAVIQHAKTYGPDGMAAGRLLVAVHALEKRVIALEAK